MIRAVLLTPVLFPVVRIRACHGSRSVQVTCGRYLGKYLKDLDLQVQVPVAAGIKQVQVNILSKQVYLQVPGPAEYL